MIRGLAGQRQKKGGGGGEEIEPEAERQLKAEMFDTEKWNEGIKSLNGPADSVRARVAFAGPARITALTAFHWVGVVHACVALVPPGLGSVDDMPSNLPPESRPVKNQPLSLSFSPLPPSLSSILLSLFTTPPHPSLSPSHTHTNPRLRLQVLRTPVYCN